MQHGVLVAWHPQMGLPCLTLQVHSTSVNFTTAFSISREFKALDRIGKSVKRSFIRIFGDQLLRFLRFDCERNVLFVAGNVVMQ